MNRTRYIFQSYMLSPAEYQAAVIALLDALAADGRVTEVLEGTNRTHLVGPQPAP